MSLPSVPSHRSARFWFAVSAGFLSVSVIATEPGGADGGATDALLSATLALGGFGLAEDGSAARTLTAFRLVGWAWALLLPPNVAAAIWAVPAGSSCAGRTLAALGIGLRSLAGAVSRGLTRPTCRSMQGRSRRLPACRCE
jgi:hypothetical protein